MGIAPAMLPRVFELFAQETQSLDRAQGGLGLGLTIVKNLVAMHGGTISAFSAGHGKGSAFTLELPGATAHEVIAAPKVHLYTPGLVRRVLVVDDNADLAESIADLLSAQGHTVVIAADGPAALQLAGTFHPEIALLDIGLPGMDGYELARELRRQNDPVRLIALTGYGQDADRVRALAAGFDTHLVQTRKSRAAARCAGLRGPPSARVAGAG